MTRLFIFVGALGICGGLILTNARAVPTPIFYTPLETEADSITALGGTTPVDHGLFVSGLGIAGNAYQSNNSGTNNGGYAQWNNTSVGNIFTTWDDAAGITIDHYFGASSLSSAPAGVSEGFWALVKRSGGTIGDQYIFTSLRGGKLRIAFADSTALQYKFSFDGSAPNPGMQEYAPSVDIPLVDNTPYHLTVSLGNGALKVYLDDTNGNTYSNASPIFQDTTTLPSGFNWTLPNADPVASSGTTTGRQNREMDIGIRGFGNTGNTVNNFGGSMRIGTWVDEVNVYNGVYSPADLAGTTPTPPPGDYNGDLVVDAADYVIWRKNSPNNSGLATVSMGDGTGDGNVLADDYDYWRARFGNASGSGAGAGLGTGAAVPEPSMAVLAVGACLAFAMRRSLRK